MSRSEGSDLDAQYLLSHMKSRKGSSLGVAFCAPSCTSWPDPLRTGRMTVEWVFMLPLLPSLPPTAQRVEDIAGAASPPRND